MNQKDDDVPSFPCFPVTISFLCHTVRDDLSAFGGSRFAGETESNQPLRLLTSHCHQVQFNPKIHGWSAGQVAVEFWKVSLINPRLVQILKSDRSVSAVWPEPSCDLNTEELTQMLTVSLSLCLSASPKLIINSQTKSRTIINHNFILLLLKYRFPAQKIVMQIIVIKSYKN